MALGPRDKSSLVMLTGWDATELQNFTLQDGSSIEQVFNQFNIALGALNQELVGGLWGSMIGSVTAEPEVEYRVGSSNGMVRHTEYGRPDAYRANTEGHMLPYLKWDRGLGWTFDYLEEARLPQIQADIADAIKDLRDRWRLSILTRLLQRGDDSGTNSGLGSGGYSPGFATAAASTSVDFTPPTFGGTTFDSDHEHYVGTAGGAFTDAIFADVKAELREHGHEPPYEFITGPADEAAVRALTGTTEVATLNINYGADTALANLPVSADSVGTYPIGVNSDFNIYIVRGMPQYYGFGWKSYGQLSPRNPLGVRVKKGMTAVQATASGDPRNGSPSHPLQYMLMQLNFGVGVIDRTNGTTQYNNNATWADGTPT